MPAAPNRAIWGTILVLTLLWIGLAAGTAVGARFVPQGSGLAGPAIALGYGVVGALSAGLIGGLLVWRLSPRALRGVSFVGIAISLMFVALAGWRMASQRADRRAKAGLDEPLPAPLDLRIHAEWSELQPNRSFREMDIDGSTWDFRYIAVGPEAAECQGVLNAAEAEALVGAGAADIEQACLDAGAAAMLTVEIERDGKTRRVVADAACLQRSRELQLLQGALFRIPIDAVSHGRVSCN